MRPAIVDRLSVIVIAAALVLWCGCLVILWALAFDASGVSAPSALGGLLLGVWVSAGWPGRVARGAQRLLGWLGMQDVPAMELATARASGARRVEARAMTRLLAAAAIFAAVCGTLSTLAIYASKSLADILPARFAATHVAWRGLELVAYFVGMLPMALGMVVAFLVSAILRGGSGRDVYASVVREWLLAAALGLVALAAAWWWGANLLGLARVMAVLLLAVAGMLFQRQEVTIRPRLGGSAIEPGPQRRKRLGIAVTFALLVLVLAVQGRVLCDVFAVDAGGVACWAGVSLLLLTMAMRKVDRRSRPPGRAQEIGATIGVSACLMLQLALGVACLYLGPGWMLVGVLAAAAQVPLARLGAVLLSRQRRLFATGGGRARTYLSSAAGGAAVGLCGYVLAMSLAGGGMVLLGVGLVVLTWSAVRGIGVAKRPVRQVQWAACAAALMCAVTAATIVCVRRVREEIGPVRPGAWLSGLPLRRVADGWARAGGYLPLPSPRPSEAVTRALAEALLDGRYGSRWWSLVGSAADMPADWPRQGMTVVSSPDGDVGLRAAGGPVVLGAEGAGLRAVGSGDPFEATFLAPLPADHPQAWRCYNETVMSRHSRRAPGGVMVLRTQAQAGNARAVLAVAKTFQTVMGSGWAAFHIDERTIDVLLIGPEDAARRPVGVEGLTVVSLAALFDGATWRVRPIRVSAPSAGWGRWAGAIDLRARLRQVARGH